MRFQRVTWEHEFPDEPVLLFSEIGDDGFEIRKVEVFRDGRHDFADANDSTGSTMLGDQVVPSIEEIDADPEFHAVQISHDEFEEVWNRATARA